MCYVLKHENLFVAHLISSILLLMKQAPVEHVLLWNEKALQQQEENIRSNRNQFSFIDAKNEVVGVLQVQLSVQERSGRNNVPDSGLIPYKAFSCYCQALSDHLEAEDAWQDELVHCPLADPDTDRQAMYTSTCTILKTLRDSRPFKVTYENLKGDKILVPLTIPTKYAAKYSLVLCDCKLYLRCGNDHFDINLAAYRIKVSDFSLDNPAVNNSFSITIIDRKDDNSSTIVTRSQKSSGNDGSKNNALPKTLRKGDRNSLSFVRQDPGFMRFIVTVFFLSALCAYVLCLSCADLRRSLSSIGYRL